MSNKDDKLGELYNPDRGIQIGDENKGYDSENGTGNLHIEDKAIDFLINLQKEFNSPLVEPDVQEHTKKLRTALNLLLDSPFNFRPILKVVVRSLFKDFDNLKDLSEEALKFESVGLAKEAKKREYHVQMLLAKILKNPIVKPFAIHGIHITQEIGVMISKKILEVLSLENPNIKFDSEIEYLEWINKLEDTEDDEM